MTWRARESIDSVKQSSVYPRGVETSWRALPVEHPTRTTVRTTRSSTRVVDLLCGAGLTGYLFGTAPERPSVPALQPASAEVTEVWCSTGPVLAFTRVLDALVGPTQSPARDPKNTTHPTRLLQREVNAAEAGL